MLSNVFAWAIVAYFAGMALYLVGGVAWDLFELIWDDVIPKLQGRRARTRRPAAERPARIPRRVDLRDGEAVDMWLDRRGLRS
jgi:hypothetical protein